MWEKERRREEEEEEGVERHTGERRGDKRGLEWERERERDEWSCDSMLNYKCVGSEAWSHTPSSLCLQCGWFIDGIWHAGHTHKAVIKLLPSSEMVPH